MTVGGAIMIIVVVGMGIVLSAELIYHLFEDQEEKEDATP